MRNLFLASTLLKFRLAAIALLGFGISPAQADIRDASLGIEGNTALSVVRFDGQPGEVRIQKTEQGVVLFVPNVRAKTTRITPPDTHLVQVIEVEGAENGVYLHYHFSALPETVSANVYAHSILLRAAFTHLLKKPKATINFASVAKPAAKKHQSAKQAAPMPAVAPPAVSHKPAHKTDAAAMAEAASMASEDNMKMAAPQHDKPKFDGDAPLPMPAKPVMHGTGMVREASHTAPAKVDAQSCAAAQAIVEEDPWALDKLSLYGACIAKEGKTDEAKEVFERLLTFDPDMVSAYLGLGAISQDSGDTDAAKRYYQKVLSLGGTDAQSMQARNMINSLTSDH